VRSTKAEVGERLREAWTFLGERPSQREIAREINVSIQRLNHWFMARANPPARYLGGLASILGINAGWLSTGTGRMIEGSTRTEVQRVTFRDVDVFRLGAGRGLRGKPMAGTHIRERQGLGPCFGIVVESALIVPEILPGDVAIFEERVASIGHVVHAASGEEEAIGVLDRVDGRPYLTCLDASMSRDLVGWVVTGVVVAVVREFGGGHTRTDEYVFGVRTQQAAGVPS
jgi:transcriptional regulator with XRE-family HTH domain